MNSYPKMYRNRCATNMSEFTYWSTRNGRNLRVMQTLLNRGDEEPDERETHVWNCESLGVRFPRATRLNNLLYWSYTYCRYTHPLVRNNQFLSRTEFPRLWIYLGTTGNINNLECSICSWFSGSIFDFFNLVNMLLFGKIFRHGKV